MAMIENIIFRALEGKAFPIVTAQRAPKMAPRAVKRPMDQGTPSRKII